MQTVRVIPIYKNFIAFIKENPYKRHRAYCHFYAPLSQTQRKHIWIYIITVYITHIHILFLRRYRWTAARCWWFDFISKLYFMFWKKRETFNKMTFSYTPVTIHKRKFIHLSINIYNSHIVIKSSHSLVCNVCLYGSMVYLWVSTE